MRECARAFVDRYGILQEVPLLAVLNNEIGLGSPPMYKNPAPVRHWLHSPPEESMQHKEWLAQLLGEALQAAENFATSRNHPPALPRRPLLIQEGSPGERAPLRR
jgi:hypothetical protein